MQDPMTPAQKAAAAQRAKADAEKQRVIDRLRSRGFTPIDPDIEKEQEHARIKSKQQKQAEASRRYEAKRALERRSN